MPLRLVLLAALAATASAFVPIAAPLAHRTAVQHCSDVAMTAATKPMRTNARRRAYNKMYTSKMRTLIKKVEVVVQEGNYAAARPVLSEAFSIIDKNVKRNLIHKNTAARKKSQLSLKVKALEPAS